MRPFPARPWLGLLLGAPLLLAACGPSPGTPAPEIPPSRAESPPAPDPDWDFAFRLLDRDGNGVFDAADLADLSRTEGGDESGKLGGAAFARLLGSLARYAALHSEGPPPGVPAPDVRLTRLEDGSEAPLASAFEGRPVLLLFGSETCPNVREQVRRLGEESQALPGVRVVLVYLREAHPADGPAFLAGGAGAPRDPRNLSERRAAAARLAPPGGRVTVFVDGMDDRAARAFGAWPTRLYLVGRDGRIRYRGRRFPPGDRLGEVLSRLEKTRRP